jgi:hypothetical protein
MSFWSIVTWLMFSRFTMLLYSNNFLFLTLFAWFFARRIQAEGVRMRKDEGEYRKVISFLFKFIQSKISR